MSLRRDPHSLRRLTIISQVPGDFSAVPEDSVPVHS